LVHLPHNKAGVRASALEDEASPGDREAARAATPTDRFGLRKTHLFRYDSPLFIRVHSRKFAGIRVNRGNDSGSQSGVDIRFARIQSGRTGPIGREECLPHLIAALPSSCAVPMKSSQPENKTDLAVAKSILVKIKEERSPPRLIRKRLLRRSRWPRCGSVPTRRRSRSQ